MVDGPGLIVPLQGANFQFNPQTLQSLGKAGMVFPTVGVCGKWGKLDVVDRALVDEEMTTVTVSAAGLTPAHLESKDFHLTLKTGWTIEPGARPGDFVLKEADAKAHEL